MPTIHKTDHLTDKQRVRLTKSALTQEDAVRLFFSKEVAAFTVEDVYYHLRNARIIAPKTPITSIRRAITNLSDNPDKNITNGYLIKTTEKEPGEMGVNIYKWRRKTETIQQSLFTAA